MRTIFSNSFGGGGAPHLHPEKALKNVGAKNAINHKIEDAPKFLTTPCTPLQKNLKR